MTTTRRGWERAGKRAAYSLATVAADDRTTDAEPGRDGPQPERAFGRAADVGARAAAVLAHPDARFGQYVALGVLGFLVFVGILFPAPPAILFLGVVLGSLNALVAMGLVLVYRANRIINFAQGDLGAVAAVLAVSLIVGWRVPFFLALAIGFVAAVVLGAVVEVLIIRRFASAPRLILTVVTIALSSVLAWGQLAIPTFFGYQTAPQDFRVPFNFTFDWFPVVFSAAHLLVLIAVPLIAGGLAAFFRFTRTGIAVRAAAESADRAALLGIPVKRVFMLVWILAATLSGAAVLLRTPIVGVSIGTVLGPAILLRALASAVIARMENLPIAFGAAVVLGVLEQSVQWSTGRTLIVDAVLFAIILTALLFQRNARLGRAEDAGTSSWTAAREVRPVPRELRTVPLVRWGTFALSAGLLCLLVFAPLFMNGSKVNLLGAGLAFAIICVSLVVLTGWAGQISLGQLAFGAFGAAVAGTMAQNGWHLFACLLAGGAVGGVVAIAIGIPALRIRGPFLAVTTLAFALATGSFFINREFFPWLVPDGRITRPVLFGKFDLESEWAYYYVLLGLLVLVLASVASFRNSRAGRVLVATRDNVRAAQSYGVNPVRARLTAFAFSGSIAGIGGAALAFHQHTVPGLTLDVTASISVFIMVVIGGLGSVPGALVGAAYYTFLNYSPLTRLPASRLLGSGFGVLMILLFLRRGLGGAMYDLRDDILRRIARAKGIVVPSLLADVRTDDGQPAAENADALAAVRVPVTDTHEGVAR
ncbi:MAG: ABC transporter permease [Actinobacteria bacterium]|nr:ABC transporter permease [Actinomycetota bacterium]